MNAANGHPSPPSAAYHHQHQQHHHDNNMMLPKPTQSHQQQEQERHHHHHHQQQQHPQEQQQSQQPSLHEQQREQHHHHQQLHPPTQQQQQPFAVASSSSSSLMAAADVTTVPTADATNSSHCSTVMIHKEANDTSCGHRKNPSSYHIMMMNGEQRPLRRKRPKSMAFAYLQGQLLESSPSPLTTTTSTNSRRRDDDMILTDPMARSILQSLLLLLETDEEAAGHPYRRVRRRFKMESHDNVVTALAYVQQRFYWPKRTVVQSMSIDETLQLAKMDQLTFLGSFLMVLQEAEEAAAAAATTTASTTTAHSGSSSVSGTSASVAAVSALDLIKRCCLAIHPSKIPPLMDAEEMAIAALEFLGSNSSATATNADGTTTTTTTTTTALLPHLPLIRFVKYEADVRKRFYEKVGTWKLDDDAMMQHVMALEDVFLSDCTDYRFLRRGVCGPRMTSTAAEDALYLRGKHKVTNSGSSSSTSNASNKRNASKQQQPQPQPQPIPSAAARKTTTAATASAANSTAKDHHPIAEQEPSHIAPGSLSDPMAAEDAGEADEVNNNRSHCLSYPEELFYD